MAVCIKKVISVTTSTTPFGASYAVGNIIYNEATKEAIILAVAVTAAMTWDDITDKNYITRKTVKVSLLTTDVALLGTIPFDLIGKPGMGKALDVIAIKWQCTPSSTLDVGGQNLTINFTSISDYLATVRNSEVETATKLLKGVQVQAEHAMAENEAIRCSLNGGIDPTIGVATMDFWITYSIIDV